jgi:hypothetical protein
MEEIPPMEVELTMHRENFLKEWTAATQAVSTKFVIADDAVNAALEA